MFLKHFSKVLVLSILFLALTCDGAQKNTFKITYPKSSVTKWNGVVKGTGAIANMYIEIYIRTNKDYLQERILTIKAGNWEWDKCFPTKKQKHSICRNERSKWE